MSRIEDRVLEIRMNRSVTFEFEMHTNSLLILISASGKEACWHFSYGEKL